MDTHTLLPQSLKQFLLSRLIPAMAIFLCTTFLMPSSKAAELTKIRLAQNLSPISGITIIAKEKKFFEQAGLDVAVFNFTSGKQALEVTLGGGADITTTAEAPVTAAAMAKQPIAFVARMEYSDDKTLVSTASGINTLADLKGKRIGMTVGTGSEVYTAEMLKRAGLKKNDVSIINLPPQNMAAGLSANGIDVMNSWEPHIGNAKKILGSKVKELDTKGIYSESFNIVTTQSYLKANPDTIKKFLTAIIAAEKWMKANRDEAITTVATAVGMKREDLAPIWNEYTFGVVLDNKVLDILKAHATWRLESGNAPSGATMPDFSKIIFTEPLKSVAPDRVTIKFN
jgi:ABC-type nitrate/sulfonate/bicarbonate transport system substrate-binding protein